MKKRVKKLVLAKETVGRLSTANLVNVAGASYGAAACGNPAPSVDGVLCFEAYLTQEGC
jgi:hypothetical protein